MHSPKQEWSRIAKSPKEGSPAVWAEGQGRQNSDTWLANWGSVRCTHFVPQAQQPVALPPLVRLWSRRWRLSYENFTPQLPLPSKGLIGRRSIGCLCYLGARVSKSSLRQSETSQSQVQGYASEDLQQVQVCLFWRQLGKMEVRSFQRLKNNQLVSKTSATWGRQRWVEKFLFLFQL